MGIFKKAGLYLDEKADIIKKSDIVNKASEKISEAKEKVEGLTSKEPVLYSVLHLNGNRYEMSLEDTFSHIKSETGIEVKEIK